jgi:hypothetical protein
MPKYDEHFRYVNIRMKVESIGVCTNDLDPILRVDQLLGKIRQEFASLPILLRPHPGDTREGMWRNLAGKYDLHFSDSKTELSFDFLKKVDAIIAGDSNIHLEAALMNVIPLYYDFVQAHLDWYGFQRNGLVQYFSEPSEVCRYLREVAHKKPAVRTKAKLYCATIGTCYDGHSADLAAALIQSFRSGAVLDVSIWKRIPGINLEAYTLDNGS